MALYFLHVYNTGFTPVARKVFWEQVDHSKGMSRQLRTPKGFDAITGYRLTPICAWNNVNGEIPSLDPNPKVFMRSVFLDEQARDGHQNASVLLLEVEIKSVIEENLIVGCQIDGRNASTFTVRVPKLLTKFAPT